MVHSGTHRRILLGTLMLFCITLSRAGAQDRKAVSTSREGGVKLPVVDKQDIRFLPFSVNGAPRTRVRSIAQDDYGFLWLGTNSGLYRYDGYRLENYRLQPRDPAKLTGDRVRTVYKDPPGAPWIGTEGGVDLLDATQTTFTHYRHDPADDRSLSP